jgi:uncharacterized damage-inducible protein DinB
MKEILKQLAAYHIWADQRIFQVILALPEEKHMAEVPSSFNSLYKTILHCWDSETAWWQRIRLQERIVRPSETFRGSMAELTEGIMQQSRQFEIWIGNASELSLDHVCQYHSTKRELFKQPVYQILMHVFNHGSYHRGQLVNMLRQLGVDKIPQTDLILFSRLRKSIS